LLDFLEGLFGPVLSADMYIHRLLSYINSCIND
ncbi:MAG: hypothetical protein K0S93_1051, partial [Nitrososphaeraceae archaeon]|nr:hypothetical protein [Nitrososphaeraceae archaeon]